jgi:hypothetical protein
MTTYEKLFKYRKAAYLTSILQGSIEQETRQCYLSSDKALKEQLIANIHWYTHSYTLNQFKHIARHSGRIHAIVRLYESIFKINPVTLVKQIKKNLYEEALKNAPITSEGEGA